MKIKLVSKGKQTKYIYRKVLSNPSAFLLRKHPHEDALDVGHDPLLFRGSFTVFASRSYAFSGLAGF